MHGRRLFIAFSCAIAFSLGAGGCDPAKPDATLSIGFNASGAYADPVNFRASLIQAGSARMIEGTDLKFENRPSGYLAGRIEKLGLSAGQQATVRISMITVSALPVEVNYSWTPQKDWNYGIDAVVGQNRPAGFCFNVVGALPLPPRAQTSGDSLFVLYAGLGDGSVC
jgi:hypothetical protein